MNSSNHLLYIADPMCSWCWGFAPVIKAVEERFRDRLATDVMVGGLAMGSEKALDNAGMQTIREHWNHVSELTCQPFDFRFFDRMDFVYDTAPACRAVVAVRRLQATGTLDFLIGLQDNFYNKNKDITDRGVLLDTAIAFGLERTAFTECFDAEVTRAETEADVRACRRMEIDGYPALLAGCAETGYSILTLGYQPLKKIEGIITTWLDDVDRNTEDCC